MCYEGPCTEDVAVLQVPAKTTQAKGDSNKGRTYGSVPRSANAPWEEGSAVDHSMNISARRRALSLLLDANK